MKAKKIIKDIEVNESVVIMYHTVRSLLSAIGNELPDNIVEETHVYLEKLIKEMQKDYPSNDILFNQYINRITFEK
jgi:hypothetical protein